MKNSGRIRFVVAIEIGSSIFAGKVEDSFGTWSLKRNKKVALILKWEENCVNIVNNVTKKCKW